MKFTQYYSPRLDRKVWRCDVTIAGQRIRRGEFSTKREAEEAVASLQLIARSLRFGLNPGKSSLTLQHLYNERAKRAVKLSDHSSLRELKNLMDLTSAHKLIVDLKRADYTALIDHYKTLRLKASTTNRYLASLSAALHSVSEYFPELDDWIPPRIPWLKEDSQRERVLTTDELSSLFKTLRAGRQRYEQPKMFIRRADVLDVIRLMLLTGARRGEVLILNDHSINIDWQTATIIATKTHSKRVIPLSDTALTIIQKRMQGGRIFKPISDWVFHRIVERASELAGVTYGNNAEGGWVPHDLRHTAATIVENDGIPYSAVSALLGHKRKDQTATYTHAQMPAIKKAVDVLENWCKGIEGFCDNFDNNHLTLKKSA
jgi:integrase